MGLARAALVFARRRLAALHCLCVLADNFTDVIARLHCASLPSLDPLALISRLRPVTPVRGPPIAMSLRLGSGLKGYGKHRDNAVHSNASRDVSARV